MSLAPGKPLLTRSALATMATNAQFLPSIRRHATFVRRAHRLVAGTDGNSFGAVAGAHTLQQLFAIPTRTDLPSLTQLAGKEKRPRPTSCKLSRGRPRDIASTRVLHPHNCRGLAKAFGGNSRVCRDNCRLRKQST